MGVHPYAHTFVQCKKLVEGLVRLSAAEVITFADYDLILRRQFHTLELRKSVQNRWKADNSVLSFVVTSCVLCSL